MEDDLVAALAVLRDDLAAATFDVPGATGAGATMPGASADADETLRDRLVAEVDGHIARVRDLDAPLLAVLGGGTGAGKSTVANSIVGQAVAATGVIRPTTSSPTLLVAPGDLPWFSGDRILPAYARSHPSGRAPVGEERGRVLHVVTSHAVPPGLAILDAPDVDSIRQENRALADELLDAADVWVWFVTARTYADEDGMRYLRRAARRRTALAVVLSQVLEREAVEVLDDLHAKLAAEGLARAEVLVVPHMATQGDRLPHQATAALRRWLHDLAEPAAARRLREQTLEGALDDLSVNALPLVEALQAQERAAAWLQAAAAEVYAAVPDRFAEAMDEGPPLRQEVVARWSTFVGTSRFLTLVESATASVRGWLRDTMATVTSAEQDRIQRQVKAEVADTVADLVVRVMDLAATDTAAAWETTEAGRALLAADPSLRRSSSGLADRAQEQMMAWQEAVTDLIATRGTARRARARWVSTIINAGATAAILATFASTGGLTGIEAGIAAGAGAANQALLVKLLGEQNLTWVLRQAREDLLERVRACASTERSRFQGVVTAVAPAPGAVEAITSALDAVARARRAS